jgi:hypothetical protein
MLIKQTLDAYAASTAKNWSHERSNTIGASEVGQCSRKVYWLKAENDPHHRVERDPEYTESWGARMRGSVFEDHFWEPAMRAMFGIRLRYAGREQRTFVKDFLSATPDGLIVALNEKEKQEIGTSADSANVECKTSDPRTNLTEAKPVNVFQTQVQMGLVREMTEFKPTHSILSYTDASFWSDVKEFVIEFNPAIYEVAKERATMIMTATSGAELKPEGWIAGGRECNYCPFTKPCGIERRNLPFQEKPVDPQFAAEIAYLANAAKAAEEARDASDRLLRTLQDEIKTGLREKGVRKIPGVVNWSSVKGRTGYDNKAIKAAAIVAGVDVEQYKTTGEPSDRLTIEIETSTDVSMPGLAPTKA